MTEHTTGEACMTQTVGEPESGHRRGVGHRPVRGRPRHRGQGARGPGLVRRRQPAAGAASPGWSTSGWRPGSRITQLAVVMDVRSRGFTGDLDLVRADLATRNIHPRVLFMEASDEILVRRYENNRRSHPLQGNQTLAEGIAAERDACSPRCGRRRPGDRHLDAVGARAAGKHRARIRRRDGRPDQRHGRVVRLQVRPADGRRHGDGRPVPAQPALGRRAAPADRAVTRRSATTC